MTQEASTVVHDANSEQAVALAGDTAEGGEASAPQQAARSKTWPHDRYLRAGLGLACLLALLAVALVLPAEFAAQKRSDALPLSHHLSDRSHLDRRAYSVEGVYLALGVCDREMSDALRPLMDEGAQRRVAEECLSLSDGVLEEAPTLSLAHLVRAQSLASLDDRGEAATSLVQSQRTSGALVWIAQRRLQVAFNLAEAGGDLSSELVARDLLLLVNTRAGLDWLVAQYQFRPALRPLVTEGLETLPEARQKAFVDLLKEASP